MPDLKFEITSVEPKSFAMVPTLAFQLRVTNAVENEEVYSAALKGQVMIEAVHRDYDAATKERLVEVFGEPGRWDETLNSLLWTYVTVPLPRFTGSTVVEVPVACTADVEVAAGKYFYAIRDGIVPPTINLNDPDPQLDLDYVPNVPRKMQVNIAMKESFGFGGQNNVVIVKKYEA